MIDKKQRFHIENYGTKPVFSNFLPGISGEKGIPLWCYYVNRGQCISCFGIQDKDHSIMEFYPAHQAYENTKRLGFRTFIKVNGKVVEGFSKEENLHTMYIGMNELEITEENRKESLKISVRYFTLPTEEVGALVRSVTIENTDMKSKDIEILDGMPALIPYGVDLGTMKTMGQTAKAWMEVLDWETNKPFFHVRVSMKDTAQIDEIKGGNFALAFDDQGKNIPVIVSKDILFSYDTSLEVPLAFKGKPLEKLLEESQIAQNEVPCCFFAKACTLGSGEKITINEIYGQVKTKEVFQRFASRKFSTNYFENKYQEGVKLTEEITKKIHTKTGNQIFDRYCRQTYLDNIIRGGYPIILGKEKVFYLYSRKHGDMERDYNYFKMLPEFYSQGNGNFRDVNQNRRCDVEFTPFVKDSNIKLFYNNIQIDGYNPLEIEKTTYFLKKEYIRNLLELIPEHNREKFEGFLNNSFTPGKLYEKLKELSEMGERACEESFKKILTLAVSQENTNYLEGYWTDHWTYNLDLIENYLSVYPDNEEKLLFDDFSYVYKMAKAHILPRRKRYKVTEKGIRQYEFIEKEKEEIGKYLTDFHGNIIHSNLIEKLLLLCIVKFSALDAYGMGIEMEGGKPGWYDALNGLPGLLGSSMSETYELARILEFTIEALTKYPRDVTLLEELSEFVKDMLSIVEKNKNQIMEEGSSMGYWNEANDSKEKYFMKTKKEVSGTYETLENTWLIKMLENFLFVVKIGIKKAMKAYNGICPTYFYYEVIDYEETVEGIYIKDVRQQKLPYFLEGSVHYMKLHVHKDRKKELYKKIRSSDLYDKKLKMYKVNASLQNASHELGRARAFTPGWLENESIWLHMEYKYLLELLKSELYQEFIEDFKLVTIPFQNEKVYGRSLFENSSFIASSANPNPNIHGQGFVARLSGSTVEFLNMWQIMMFGKTPFSISEGELSIEFNPLLPGYLIGKDKRIEATFLGEIPVVYHLQDRKDYIPGNYTIESYKVVVKEKVTREGACIKGEICNLIRERKVDLIEVRLVRDKY